MKEKYVAFNILSMVGQDSTFEQLSKSMESDEIEKAIGHKYFKREGTPGNYKYYYTEADWKNRNSIGSGEKDVEISVGDKIIGSEGVTKNRTGRVTSINGDMAQVDFGGGDKYGITLRRIKEGEFKQVKGESETGLDIKVGQKYHSPAPQGGEAIDFIVKKVDNGKYTIETTNEEGRKGEHTFDEKTIKELISESKLKEPELSKVIEKDGKKYKLQSNGKYLEISEQGMTKKQHERDRDYFSKRAASEGRVNSKTSEENVRKHHTAASKLSDKEFTKEELEGVAKKGEGNKSSDKNINELGNEEELKPGFEGNFTNKDGEKLFIRIYKDGGAKVEGANIRKDFKTIQELKDYLSKVKESK